MTRFVESAHRTIADTKKTRTGWIVTFVDGTCRLITKTQKKGTTKIEPGKIIIPCSKRCSGPDENGNCSLRKKGPRTDNAPIIKCQEQFLYAYTPHNFGTPKPKFQRSAQKMSYKIASYRTIKGSLFNDPEKWAITFEDNSTKTILKSDVLCGTKLKHGNHLVPCGEECLNRGGECLYCHGKRSGTECAQQFYFCRKFLDRHKHDKTK